MVDKKRLWRYINEVHLHCSRDAIFGRPREERQIFVDCRFCRICWSHISDLKLLLDIATDPCECGLGAEISHRFPNCKEKAIAQAGRTLTKAERVEKEACIGFRCYEISSYGRRFMLLTHHKPLLLFFYKRHSMSAHSAYQVQRWEHSLLSYDFKIE